ncbi:beta strand repeat-containing protein [Erythrobacter dokdonensis]|uniref:Outer membrane autotransporter barrel protein n=1 Tax=Erythrobacter dokdonensis DSW-74 TaxID=1300349 RepID=A0A1A7BE31_9SPHN|nr:hypothetical protein [Erythrobacter dokdonensis]OBV10016.1 Outer membrane autotransporter barrel protein [Erythrobacter dokdonensis DSW-74]
MTSPKTNRSRLLLGCGSAAMALALTLAPQSAAAQAINATGTVVDGAASIDDNFPGQTNVSVFSSTAVIDWTPAEDNSGNALDFLPAGTTASFIAGDSNPDFAVLNRILPSTNGNVVVIDGTVLSRVFDQAGNLVPGGFVAFYSPTGILVGSTATFDVGSLLLTTLDPTADSFPAFAAGTGPLELVGAQGSTARIQINQGAQITASAENSFFAVVAADVQMAGTALVNGSHAYVAGEVVNLTFSNGLFDIEIPVGTAAGGTVLDLGGTIGGPSSTGAGDNHMIYGVAAAGADPISLLLRGNLGFEPAQQAGIVNGEIIISANYNVFGRTVNGGSISDGIGAVFSENSATSDIRADILIDDIVSTSSLLAIGTHATRMRAFDVSSSVDGNLLLVGREIAELDVTAGLDITGDLLVSADAYGLVSGDLSDPADADAAAGTALVSARLGGVLNIGGEARISADAFAGADLQTLTAGTALGGTARFVSDGGTISVNGPTTISARALGADFSGVSTDADVRAGLAELLVSEQGDVTLNGQLLVTAEAFGRTLGPTIAGNAFGGTARVRNVGSTLSVNADVLINASAAGAEAFATGDGALADAGVAVLEVEEGGQTTVAGLLSLSANALGGNNLSGRGGNALGGVALASTRSGGALVVEGDFFANAEAFGGNGISGGDAFGGVAGAVAFTGSIDLRADAQAVATGEGGTAEFGFGGDGGNGTGGTALLRADGSLNETATLAVAGNAFVNASGTGGDGGLTDGTNRGGTGGIGQGGSAAIANQADDRFNGGAYLLAGGDNGTLSIAGFVQADASGFGGSGGNFNIDITDHDANDAGDGGDGIGGWVQLGTDLLGGDGSLGLGSATFGNLIATAVGDGGSGGFDQSDVGTGPGNGIAGNGVGGSALLTAGAGSVTADAADLIADGAGGDSTNGGTGTGGRAGILGEAGGSITLGQLFAIAQGAGGFAASGVGGTGQGGEAFIQLQGIDVTINGDAFVDASGFGGFSEGGDGGDGTGGTAFVGLTANTPGSGTITGNASIEANGFGGGSGEGATGGTGRGGLAYAQALAGSTVRFGTAQITATGVGGQNEGFNPPATGGDGFGGIAELRSLGSGSQLIIERNFTSDFFSQQTNRGAIVAALGIGERTTGGSGIGGSGTGGSIALRANLGGSIALPADPLNDPGSIGFISLLARGFGGASTVDGGTGGTGTGGNAIFEIDGGSLSMGRTNFSVFGVGGNGFNAQANITGGDGFGGTRLIRIVNGGTLTAELFAGGSGATGGNGTGTGNGGDATGGSNRVELNNGTLNAVGRMFVVDQAFGGSGNAGGNAVAGTVQFDAFNSTINFAPDGQGNFGLVLGGQTVGGNGVVSGGNATGEAVTLELEETTVTGGNFQITPLTIGGNASGPGGIGGNATAISATFVAAGSNIGLIGSNIISADARGGNGGPQGTDGVGGNAESGAVTVNFTNSQVTVAQAGSDLGVLLLSSQATGGFGDQTGSALSDIAQLQLSSGNLAADEIRVEAQAFAAADASGQIGGAADGGVADISMQGGAVLDAGLIALASNALTSTGGFSQAGQAVVQALNGGGQLAAENLTLFADAEGSDTSNIAGRFELNVLAGNLSLTNLTASALGDTLATSAVASQLVADGGSIAVTGNLDAIALGDIEVRTGQGGLIGALPGASTDTAISLTSQGLITILGDNEAAVGLGGQTISLTSFDLDILAGSRIGAEVISVTSLETAATAILGGTASGDGFTLTADELARLDGFALDFFLPEVDAPNDPNLPDLLIRDLVFNGSRIGSVQILTGADVSGIVRVEGTARFENANVETSLSIRAAERIEVVTPGGIRITDANGAPSGLLALNAGTIWAADSDTIAQLQADPTFAGRDDVLAVAAQGSDDPLGYLRARLISLGAGGQLLIRNTGTTTEQGGVLVGAGGLSIFADPQYNQGTPLDVFAYGRRQRDDGTFVTGEEFFNEVNFNRAVPNATTYLDAAAFNDCIINTGVCPTPPPPTPPPSRDTELPPLNNPTVIVDPVNAGDPVGPSPVEQDEKFGMDFPERPEAPLISEEPLLDDPVASGSDASVYAPPEEEK